MKTVKTMKKATGKAVKATAKKVVNKVEPKKTEPKKTEPKKESPKAVLKKVAPKATEPKTEQKTAPKASLKVITTEPVKAPTETPATMPDKPRNEFEGNLYRHGSYYSIAFGLLAKMGLEKPVSRKSLLQAYIEATGKPEKLANYDLSVVLSPRAGGLGGHKSARNNYYVQKLNDGLFQLHMAN